MKCDFKKIENITIILQQKQQKQNCYNSYKLFMVVLNNFI